MGLKYKEAQKESLKVRWKTSYCGEGVKCWCRIISPEVDMFDEDDNEIYIAGTGCVPTLYAEHLVELHNKSIE